MPQSRFDTTLPDLSSEQPDSAEFVTDCYRGAVERLQGSFAERRSVAIVIGEGRLASSFVIGRFLATLDDEIAVARITGPCSDAGDLMRQVVRAVGFDPKMLGLTLIPRWGVTGAAGAMLATEAVVAVLAVIAGSRVAGARAALSVLARAGLAGAGLAGALLAARSLGLGAPVRIGLGILVVYPILTLALRAFRTQDLRLLLTALGARRKG